MHFMLYVPFVVVRLQISDRYLTVTPLSSCLHLLFVAGFVFAFVLLLHFIGLVVLRRVQIWFQGMAEFEVRVPHT